MLAVQESGRQPLRDRSNLTNGQLVIWMGQQLAPGRPCYANALVSMIRGPVDHGRFADALQAVIDESDALRTVIEEVDGVPRQRTLSRLEHRIPVVDLSTDGDPDLAFAAWARERVLQPHDLTQRSFDTALVVLEPDRTAWYLNVHHILYDGRAVALLWARIAAHYRALGDGSSVDPLPAEQSFAEYAAAERAARQSSGWRAADALWRDAVERYREPLELYGVASTERSAEEEWMTVDLGAERTAALRGRAGAEGFRSFNADTSLLAVFATLVLGYLHRASGGRRTLSIALPFSNRQRSSQHTIGMVQQVYPLIVDVDPDETFVTLHRKVARGLLDIGRRMHEGGGNLTHRAASDVMLNYLPLSFGDFAGLPTTTQWVPRTAADGSHCLVVQVHDFDDRGSLDLGLIFNAGVVDPQQHAAACEHLLRVVDQFLDDPTRRLLDVDLLTTAERHRLVSELNDTDRPWPHDQTIDQLVAAQARRTPGAVAVEWGDRSITYRELDEQANRLAHHLRSLGAEPGVLVGVYAGRSLDLMVAVLAIFKTGAGYLPLDVTYPVERLELILEDSRASLLITDAGMSRLHGRSVRAVVLLDDLDATLAVEPATALAPSATPDDLAYVIYTSGSTGRPKGAAMPNRALVNVVWWQAHAASALTRPRTLQFSPLSFDVSLQEIFATWCAGGTLVVPQCDVRRDPEALAHLLRDRRVEQLFAILTPLQRLAEAVERLDLVPEHLREVIACGEPLTVTPVLRRFFERLPGCRFQNQYGSSEDFIVTFFDLPGPASTWPTAPPIGRPLPNTRVYVLDAAKRPVPMGVPGEIHVAGAPVSLGYLHRPDLTAERFGPDPFDPDPTARLFATGDLARVLPSGDLQFLGRADDQIKLRGFRIEPAEIEAALQDHPGVAEAAVVLREDEPGAKRLVAYLVPGAESEPVSLPELHRSLLQRLPPYMVPASVVTLDALPKTPSGKLDRRSLPRPDSARPELDAAYEAPMTGLERDLVDIWQLALHLDRVGLHDDFFDLGGDSLLALEVAEEMGRVANRHLPLATLFEAPTIAQVVSRLGDVEWTPSRRTLVPVRASGSKTPLYFVATASGRRLVDHLDPERPFYTLHARGFADDQADQRIEDMAAGYIEEIQTLQPHGPYLLGGACMGGQVAFEMARQLVARGEQVAETIIVESYAPGVLGFPTRHWRGRLFSLVFFNRRTRSRRLGTRWLATADGSALGDRLLDLVSRLRHVDRHDETATTDSALRTAMHQVQRARLRALLAYAPEPLEGAITVFRGERSGDDVPALGWEGMATGGVEVRPISGQHETVLTAPHVTRLAAELNACLERSGL